MAKFPKISHTLANISFDVVLKDDLVCLMFYNSVEGKSHEILAVQYVSVQTAKNLCNQLSKYLPLDT
jgi:hypothetical protein